MRHQALIIISSWFSPWMLNCWCCWCLYRASWERRFILIALLHIENSAGVERSLNLRLITFNSANYSYHLFCSLFLFLRKKISRFYVYSTWTHVSYKRFPITWQGEQKTAEPSSRVCTILFLKRKKNEPSARRLSPVSLYSFSLATERKRDGTAKK